MFRKLPAVTVLACLLSGCGSIMKPSALPNPAPVIAPEVKPPVPSALTRAADAARNLWHRGTAGRTDHAGRYTGAYQGLRRVLPTP